MHYVICYDLENDRLREKVAKLLQKHGCSRVQKSVFVAANLHPKHLDKLKTAAMGIISKANLSPQDSLLLIPLPEECVRMATVIGGANIILAATQEAQLKTLI